MLVNPVSFRLSVSFFWNSTWSLYKNNNYKYLFSSDLVFFEFFMFFFRKTIELRSLDYYPSHIRLYRLNDKVIINLYYHMSKDEYYFDEIDLIYKGTQKRVAIKKSLLKKRLLKISNNNQDFFNLIKKFIKFINKNLIKIIYLKLFFFKNTKLGVKSDLYSSLKLKWKIIKKFIKNKLNIVNNIENWSIIKKFIKKYYFKMGKEYIYFFLNNKDLICNFKSKKCKKFKHILYNYDNDLQILIYLKFKKAKDFSNFLYSFNLILKKCNNIKKKHNLNIGKKFLDNVIEDKIYYNFNNKLKLNNKLIKNSDNFIKNLMKLFWKKKIKNVVSNFENKKLHYKLVNQKEKKFNKIFKEVKHLHKSELDVVKQLKKDLFFNIKNKNIRDTTNASNKFFNEKKNKFSIKKYNKVQNVVCKVGKVFNKIDSYKKLGKIHTNILTMRKFVDKKFLKSTENFSSLNKFNYLYRINFLKFVYNQKLWIFNIYYYYLSKFLKKISKKLFPKFVKKLELNVFKINMHSIRADIVSKYITSSFKHNYSVYETMRPVLVDLKDRMKKKKVAGFKITVSGRFKRAQRATYWWKKDGQLLTGTQTAAIDYSSSLHKTKYGVCTVNVWLTPGSKGLGSLVHEYPVFYPFFFMLKQHKSFGFNYFLLKKNELFFVNLLKKCQILSSNLKKNYVKGLIMYLLYKYLYINMFLKNIFIKNDMNKVNKYLRRIFLPQYCVYKIYLEDYLKKNYIKIIPFIQIKLLKRINLRNSYKISFLNKSKLVHLDIFKYKISLN